MGPCRDCGKWHCAGDRFSLVMRALRDDIDRTIGMTKPMLQHQAAQTDRAFQSFMAKVLHG